jgi:hypothetical protein
MKVPIQQVWGVNNARTRGLRWKRRRLRRLREPSTIRGWPATVENKRPKLLTNSHQVVGESFNRSRMGGMHPTASNRICQAPFAGRSSPATAGNPPPTWARNLCRCSGCRCDCRTAQVRHHARQAPMGTGTDQEPKKHSNGRHPPSGGVAGGALPGSSLGHLHWPVAPRSAAGPMCDRSLPASRPTPRGSD